MEIKIIIIFGKSCYKYFEPITYNIHKNLNMGKKSKKQSLHFKLSIQNVYDPILGETVQKKEFIPITQITVYFHF